MKWANIGLIFRREVRDQLRDRRTMFTIAVLPLLLYPLLGMSMLQVAQFMREHPTKILILGADDLPEHPRLIEGDRFASEFCSSSEEAELLHLVVNNELVIEDEARLKHFAQEKIRSGEFDAVVRFPSSLAGSLAEYRRRLESREIEPGIVPEPTIYNNTAIDKSRIAYDRVSGVLARWRQTIVDENLAASNIPASATRPFEVTGSDVAGEVSRRAAIWSKILPFVVLIWALTGAFYPAVDLCAGEKERGTLETLLCSPASRGEIVWGKLLTVMVFSMATSLLNLASMGFTGAFIIRQMEMMGAGAGPMMIGPPPLFSVVWLVLALIPIAALFSALSLAVAAFARSSKEGQYYLMPLLLITLPLMMLPLLPAAELDLGTSLIPVTGMMLLLRTLIEGQYLEALRYAFPVIGVTCVCCLLAIRWAVDQFNNESVIFRESERWGLGTWVRHLVRDRGDTPTFGEAILCGILILLVRFFASFSMTMPETWNQFTVQTITTMLAFIATPALLMTIMLTLKPAKTLQLRLPVPLALPAAVALAFALHPAAMSLAEVVQQIYPFSEDVKQQLAGFTDILNQAPGTLSIILVIALAPAICEEIAFRGFILSGLRQSGRPGAAILISSLLFGAAHGILQQSITASVVGMVLGYIAIQTGSIFPCMLYHLVHNSLGVLVGSLTAEHLAGRPLLGVLFAEGENGALTYTAFAYWLGLAIAVPLILWLRGLRSVESPRKTLPAFKSAAASV